MPITHTFVNPKSDGGDATITRPSDWNAEHTITGMVASAFIGASAYHSTTQGSLAASTVNALSLDSEDYDSDAFHSTSSNTSRITIPTGLGGKYLIIGKVKVNQDFEVYVRKNGSTILRGGQHQTASFVSEVSVMADLVAGDYVELVEFHSSGTGTAGDASNDHLRTQLQVYKLDSGRLGQAIGAKVRRTSNQSISTDPTTLLWDIEDYDTDGFHDNSSNTGRLTCPTGLGGTYLVSCVVEYSGTSPRLNFYKNGSVIVIGPQIGSFTEISTIIVDLVPGDYIEAKVGGVTGQNVVNTDVTNYFMIKRLDSVAVPTLAVGRKNETAHANYTTTSSTFADVDATALGTTITTGARRVLILFTGFAGNNGGSTTAFDVTIDGTRQGGTLGLTGTNDAATGLSISYVSDVLTAGSHTFNLQWKVSGNTGTLFVGTTGFSAHLSVVEISN